MEDKKAMLVEKLENELDAYKANLLTKSANEIYENSNKTTCMQEIKDVLVNGTYLSNFDIKTLLKKSDILGEFYNEWQKVDGSLSESLEFSVENTIQEIRDMAVKENRQKSKLDTR